MALTQEQRVRLDRRLRFTAEATRTNQRRSTMITTEDVQASYNVTCLAKGYCFTEQKMVHPPQVDDRICINGEEFIVKARMFEWSDNEVGVTGPVGVFVKMVPASDSWDD